MTAEERVAAAIDAVPELRGARGFERLGGITNDNFKVKSPAGAFVVRVACADSDLLDIDRSTELANCQEASAAGIGTPFVSPGSPRSAFRSCASWRGGR
jgi:Ser/Thr protein kinase RdoA (MazF antagonist)